MKLRFFAIFSTLSVLATGCVIDNPAAYDPCKTAKDCSGALADVCITLTQNWGGGVSATNSICTSKVCSSDLDCSLSANNNRGYCSTNSILGAPANTCFERCYYDGDCSPGFACAGSKDVVGLNAGEQICVPQGAGVVKPKDQYTTCTGPSQCSISGSICEEINPKWDNTVDTFALSICTVNCSSDATCPTSTNGELGYCAKMDDVSFMMVCIERCDVSTDCDAGFVCAPMSDVTGLPENTTDRICLPDPKFAH